MIAWVEARARGVAVAIVVAYLAIQIAGLNRVGLTDDDDFYIPAGASYIDWVGRAFSFEKSAWSRQAIDAAFQPNHEHPPFAKYVFGATAKIFRMFGATGSARFGTVLFSTLAAAVLMWLAVSHLGRRRGLAVGGLSVLFLLTLPRFYFHSHAATLDVPVAAMYLSAAAVVLHAERSRRAAWIAGIVFGLALATKLNAPFLLVGYFVFFVLVRRGRFLGADEPPVESKMFRLPSVPLAFVSMLVLGPLVFFAVWPWLWFDTIARIGQYIGFHLNHYGIHLLYFGQVYTKDPFAPWHAPFVMAASTVPLAVGALALAGIRYAWTPIVVRLRFTDGPDDDMRKEGDLLLTAIIHAALSIAVVAFSGGAKYGGEKLFMPFFPFWCLLAAYGAVALYEVLRSSIGKRSVAAGVIGLAAVSALALQIRFGEYALSAYNALLGGLRGATALGMERQYYDIAFLDLVDWLDDEAPRGLKIHFLPNNWEYERTYKWYKRDGVLRNDIQVVNNEALADWIVVTHERRFSRYGEDLLRHRSKPVLREKIVDGTPIWTVLRQR